MGRPRKTRSGSVRVDRGGQLWTQALWDGGGAGGVQQGREFPTLDFGHCARELYLLLAHTETFGNSLVSAFSDLFVLKTTSLSLSLEDLLGDGLILLLVNGLHEVLLVLEDVTLGSQVEVVVHVLVDLVGISVLLEKTTEDAHAADPQNLAGHTGILGTSSLTEAGVSTETLGLKSLAGSVARVNNGGLADDETVLDEFADILTRIGHGDFAGFIRIQPDLAFTAIHNRRREALLQLQDDHPPTTRSEKKPHGQF